VREWLAAIACPALLVAADPPQPYFEASLREERAACVPHLRSVVLPGNHHLHLEDPAPVAREIRAFLAA
jgi:pimeloyl-ACP methyl ester carboxylesterase